jgi:spermidine/putrescine transport system permease protein
MMSSQGASLIKAEASDTRRRWLLSLPSLVIIFLFAVGPLFIVLFYSFLTPGPYGGVSFQPSSQAWFRVLFEQDIFDDTISIADAHVEIFLRSTVLAIVTTVLAFIFGFPTAYFIATRPEKTRELWLFLITIPFWTNLLIRTFAIYEVIRNEGVINSALMGSGLTSEPTQLLYTNFAILLGLLYVFLPLMVLPIYASMEKLDFRLVEAGYDLYATRWQVLRRIIFPLVKPGVVAGSLLVFIPALGSYVTARILGGGKHMLIGNFIEFQFGQGRNWPLGASLSMTLMVIVLIAMVFYVRNANAEKRADG